MDYCKFCSNIFNKHTIFDLIKCDNNYRKEFNKTIFLFTKIYFKEINNIKQSENKTKHYQCEFCNKIIINKQNYKLHIKNKTCQKIKNSKEFICEKCGKKFMEKKNLIYHSLKIVCDKNNIINNSNNRNNITNNITNIANTNITNDNITNNNNQIININLPNSTNVDKNVVNQVVDIVEMLPFRNSKYDISPKKYLEYAKNPETAIKSFVKDEHFNPKKPERMNVLDTNSRSNKINVFDYDEDFNVRWLLRSKEDIYYLLYNRGVNNLFVAKNILNTHGIKLDIITEQRLNEKIKEYENDEKSKKEQINMISNLTYNYREIVATNKKTNKQLLNK